METGFAARIFFVMLVTGAMAVAQGAVQEVIGKVGVKPGGDADVLMKCFYVPAADAQSSSLPTYPVGFKFSLMRNNDNQISVDTYSLNEQTQPIKQIGHAELIGGASTVSTATKASALLANLQLSENSPFDFAITYSNSATISSPGARFTAVVDAVTTFSDENFTSIPVQCRVAPEKTAADAALSK
jgi:hypothetical protein